jgi:AcrR family transcriptional regulator
LGIVERRERERQQRRTAIINAAESIFFSKGFDAATLDDIAEIAEISKATVYLYFKRKHEICLSIIDRSLRKIYAEFEVIQQQKQLNGAAKLGELGRRYADFCAEHPGYHLILTNYHSHRDKCEANSRQIRQLLSRNQQILTLIHAVLEAGIQDGSVRSNVDTGSMVQALWGELSGILPIYPFAELQKSGLVVFLQFWENVVRGLRPMAEN